MAQQTPQEKALELIHKYVALTDGWVYGKSSWEYKKKCASIAVDEIIKSREDDGSFDDSLSSTSSEYYTPHPMYLTFWLQVKDEIEKL